MLSHADKFLAVTAAAALMFSAFSFPSYAAKVPDVDVITLENEVGDDDVAADLGWKVSQDDQMLEEIAEGCDNLVLIVNNLNDDTDDAEIHSTARRIGQSEIPGNSRAFYFSRNEDGNWKQVFTVNCMVSGGEYASDTIYGSYKPVSAFGIKENPGSILSYCTLSEDDYLILDPDSEEYGSIIKARKIKADTDYDLTYRLEGMRALSNYGMILAPEGGTDDFIVMNCQQSDIPSRTFAGIQLSEDYVRMLIQTIDGNSRIVIVGDTDELF